MADQITDGRTLVSNADAVTSFVDLTGSAAGTLDTEIFIQGTGSIGQYITSSRDGLLLDAGAAQDWSNNVFYLWINSGIVGLLAAKASGGFTIRFCGSTVTDWFEVFVAGSDDWPAAVSGGWTMFVVDIETARSTAVTNGWTNGTPPATTAIRYVGYSAVTGGTMPRMVDNTWLDAIWRLPDGTAGILIEGRNSGTTDWNWDDVVSASQSGAWGTARYAAGGGIALNTPVQFFVDDGSTHAFTDSNRVILWEDQEFAAADLYGLTVLGASTGTANFTAGVKTGSGSSATGAQGWVVAAATTGVRWYFDADIANIDLCGLYGCTFIHGSDLQLDAASSEVISCQLIDCSSLVPDNAASFQFNSVIDANTTDGVAFITSDDLSDIENCSFEFSDGHAIEITSAAGSPYTFIGNEFTGYGLDGSNDAAIYNNSGGAITISISGGGDTPTVRNGAGASTTVSNNTAVTLTGLKDNTEVRVFDSGTTTELAGTENATDGTTDDRSFTFTLGAGEVVDIRIINVQYEYTTIDALAIPSSDTSIPVQQRFDRNYRNP